MISVIIPVYNHARELERCLRSLERQTFKDFEVIVVDDGSDEPLLFTDYPSRLGRSEADGLRITKYDRPHLGAPTARNFGFSQSKGEYVIFCDADVFMYPKCLLEMYEALLANPSASFAYSNFKWGWKKFRLWPFSAERLRRDNYIHTTSLLRRSAFPGFDESLKRFQDWDLWLTLVEQGKTGVWVPRELFKITERKRNGMSQWFPKFLYRFTNTDRVRAFAEAKEIVKKKHKLK